MRGWPDQPCMEEAGSSMTDLSVNIEPTSMDLSNGRRNAAGWNRSIDLPRQKEFADVKIVTPLRASSPS
jgi:hypothetical protein